MLGISPGAAHKTEAIRYIEWTEQIQSESKNQIMVFVNKYKVLTSWYLCLEHKKERF